MQAPSAPQLHSNNVAVLLPQNSFPQAMHGGQPSNGLTLQHVM